MRRKSWVTKLWMHWQLEDTTSNKPLPCPFTPSLTPVPTFPSHPPQNTKYQGTTQRDGHYESPSFGTIDFNEDLSEPVYAKITFTWESLFSPNGSLANLLTRFATDINAYISAAVDDTETGSVL